MNPSRWRRRFLAACTAAVLTVPLAATTFTAARADDGACEPGNVEHVPGPPPVLEQLGIAEERNLPTGAGITIAIVDSGVDGTHPALAPAIQESQSISLVDDDAPSPLTDMEGHGTAVAGVISAQPSDEFGAHGLAADAELVSIRVYRASDENTRNSGLGPEPSRIAQGIREAVSAGAEVIVVPLSHPASDPELEEAALHAVSRGALVVASAGNRATASDPRDTPRYPAAYPGVLSVTAVDATGQATDASIHGPHLDIAAPGQNVLTTANGAGDCIYATDAPSTSFATAYVAGAAAMLAETYPEEGPEGWAYRLMATADRPDPDARNDRTGWGIIRPLEALRLRSEVPPRGPINPLSGTAGAEISRPPTQVTPAAPGSENWQPYLLVAIVAGGLVLVFALGTALRGRSPQLPQDPPSAEADEDRNAQAQEGEPPVPPVSAQ